MLSLSRIVAAVLALASAAACSEHYSPEATTKAFAMSTCRKGESCGLLPPRKLPAACDDC